MSRKDWFSLEMKGIEPSAPTVRTERRHLPGLGFLVEFQATLVVEVHRRARKGTVGQQVSPVESSALYRHGPLDQGDQSYRRRLGAMERTRSVKLGTAARPVAIPEAFDWAPTASGTVTLPFHVRWSDPVNGLRHGCARGSASRLRTGPLEDTEADVRHYVDPKELASELFGELVLPPTVRRTWQEWFLTTR